MIELASGTKISTGAIVDNGGSMWFLAASADRGMQVVRNGSVDASTANVALLLYLNQVVYHHNVAGGWWYWSGAVWVGTTDPRVGNVVAVNLVARTGVPVPATLFGIGSSGNMSSDRYATTNSPAWQVAAKSLNMSLYRPNFGNSSVLTKIFTTKGIPDWSHIDTLLKNLPTFFDVANGRLVVTLGGKSVPAWLDINSRTGQTQYADCCVQIARRFADAGVECLYWELWNEPDSLDINVYCTLFNAASVALKAYGSSRGKVYNLGGVTDSWMQADRIKTFAQKCRPDFVSYHHYVTGPGDGTFQPGNLADTPTVMQKAIANYARAATDCRAALAGSTSANVPIFLGEWNIVYTPDSGGENYNIDPRQITNEGAVFVALAFNSIIGAAKNVTMGALWELYADTFYGTVRTDNSISAQGALFSRLTTTMAGDQVRAYTSGSMNLKCLAVTNGPKFGVMLVNYDAAQSYTVAMAIVGPKSSTVNSFEISAGNLTGRNQTMNVSALKGLNIPAMSVVIISG